ncbi:MAG TPA: branched-chain amino acid ABC transporter permease [Candidatus Dormibacteraeota bacterium]|nr:branched-chain amino acid ABC transporter permease [Candidatus Dormibacteraeota bacterium]
MAAPGSRSAAPAAIQVASTIASRSATRPWLGVLAVLAAAFVAGVYVLGNTSQLYFWTTVAETILFAMAVNLLFGQTGMLSFGQAAYFGIGAYAVGLLAPRQPNPLAMLALSALAGGAASVIVGLVTLRTTELVFAMLTLAFGMALYSITFHVQAVGGENGIVGIIPPNLFWIVLGDPHALWVFTAAVVAAGVAFLWMVASSPFGRTLKMIRDDPARAENLGIPVFRYRLAAFTMSGAMCGLAGALYAYVQDVASPDAFFWTTSGTPVIVSLLGGAGFFFGPAVGSIVYVFATDTLSQATPAWIFWVGLGFLVVVLAAPDGILGGLHRVWRRYRRRAGAAT